MTSTTPAVVLCPGAEAVETPQERAVRRAGELACAVGRVLEVLAAIYRDEDWRHLSGRDGAPYPDFGAFVRDQLGGSASNARRYRQGVETLVAPLQELVGEDTRIPITPHDVAQLGQAGAARVLAAAPQQLAGVADGAARTAALRALIDTEIAERRSCAPGSGEVGSDEVELLPPLPPAALPAPEPVSVFTDAADNRYVAAAQAPAGYTADAAVVGAGPVADSGDVDTAQLRAALAIVRRVDPAAAAGALASVDSDATARECVDAAQRLARLGQLLKVVR